MGKTRCGFETEKPRIRVGLWRAFYHGADATARSTRTLPFRRPRPRCPLAIPDAPGNNAHMAVDDDLDELKTAAACTDLDDPEAVALLIVRAMPVVFPECVDADGEGCTPGAIAETLAVHFGVSVKPIRAGVRRAVRKRWLVRVGECTPVILKLALGRKGGE